MKIYDITPIGKPRMTRADKWKQRPANALPGVCMKPVCEKFSCQLRCPRHVRFAHAAKLEPERKTNTQDNHISQSPTATTC
jgi:hypothetical protein